MSTTQAMRTCAVGSTFWLAWGSRDYAGAYYCPRHMRDLHAAHDPRPGQAVRFISPGYGHDEWVVIDRAGDTLTVRPLGFPDHPKTRATVSATYPATSTHVTYTRGCGET